MPARLSRCYGAGYMHFITTSCYHRQPFLASPHQRDRFLSSLEQVRRCYHFVVVGYVVMPEHVHLLISEPEREDIAAVMQALKQSFASKWLRDHRLPPCENRAGWGSLDSSKNPVVRHVWQRRFYDFVVFTRKKKIEKLRYIHLNPVKRGLVIESDQWRWSSFRNYAYDEPGPVLINEALTARMRIRQLPNEIAIP